MSVWPSEINNIFDNLVSNNISQEYTKKPYTKIDLIGKLHIIHALDNGQPKAEIAKDYGVHPQTITYIYKQKEALIRKYSQKYNLLNEVRCMNLNQTLLEWLTCELRQGKVIKENHLREKAVEFMNASSEDFNCVDDWLMDFRRRNNIMKFTTKISCSAMAKEEWNNFVTDVDVNNMYIGSTFGLYHSFDFDKYVSKQVTNKYLCMLFIVNCSATDKKQLVVVGDEVPEVSNNNLKSIPVQYFHNLKPIINYQVLQNCLLKWDSDLKMENRQVTLLMDISEDFVNNFNCKNIVIKRLLDMEYVSKNIDMIVKCFKYHYRKIQMTKKMFFSKELSEHTLLDYIHMISAAWHSVPSDYIQTLLFPLESGSLYFIKDDAEDSNYSLSQWCKLYNLPFNIDKHSDLLDNYIHCDKDLPVIDLDNNDAILHVNNSLSENDSHSPSGVEAFQAMKRLVSYLQSQKAKESVVQCAKSLEDHLENGAFQEIQQIVQTNSGTK